MKIQYKEVTQALQKPWPKSRHYFWKGMTRDIIEYIQKSQKCLKAKITKHNKTPLIITDTPINAFDRVMVDTVGPLPKSENGNEYAATPICDLTKYR